MKTRNINLLLSTLFLYIFFWGVLGCDVLAQNNIWVQKADFGGTGRRMAVGFSIGTKGYIGTGTDEIKQLKDFWEWNQTTNTWTQKADFGGGARELAVGFSIGTKGYIGTGRDSFSTFYDFWEWNQASNTWTKKSNFGGGGRESAIGFSIGTKGYIGTGRVSNTIFSDFWEWDQASNKWIQKANFGGGARYGAVGFSISQNGKGYIGTGMNDSSSRQNDFWEWNQTSNIWTPKANFGGTGRYMAVGFSIGNKAYIGTGADMGLQNDFWEWEQSNNTWTQKTDFGGAGRHMAVGFSIGSRGYIGTGWYFNKDFWEYTSCSLIADAGKDTVICKGNSVKLIASGGIKYKWDTGNAFDTAASIIVSPYTTTTYIVNVSDSKCSNLVAVTVTIVSLSANISGDTFVCPGDSTTLTVSGASKYSWFNTGDTIPSINIKPVKDTLYKVTVSNGGVCPDTTLSINIAIFDTTSSIKGTTSICMGDSTVLTASSGNKYQWSTTDSTVSITVKPTTDATYTVKILNGKCSSNPSVKVTVTPYPVADTGKDTSVCARNKIMLNASGGATGATYIWNPTTNLSSSTISNPTATAVSSTKYIVTIANGKCAAKDSVTLTVNPLPTVNAESNSTINKGDSVILQASGANTYLWKLLSGLSDSTIANPTAKPTVTTVYVVTGTDANGCSNKDSVTITVRELECKEFFIPNAFSPNGNNFNDVLYVRGCPIDRKEVKEANFVIYDRWGEKVFETTDVTQGWDGTYNGKALNTGVFVYYLKATLINGDAVEQKGNVSLIR